MYLQLSTLWQDWNRQYYEGHCHLWTPAAVTLASGAAMESESRGLKRGLPPDSLPVSSLKKRQVPLIAVPRAPLDMDGFCYDAQYKILICISCKSALQTAQITWYQYLNTTHWILGPACKMYIEHFGTYDLCPPKDLVTPIH